MKSDLDIAFKEAFDKVSKLQEAVAPDVMLKFYAYYKKATSGKVFSYDNKSNIRSAFKVNARMQIKDMSSKKAKEEYIKLANTILTNK
ncbi:acyl-CoA-binding protein [Polaribacter sp.]|uniref:acyl-CoA-binding protein n=1 Tax=Polaribacter sp. TaxID=1920175 RepID=UPI003F6A1F02